MNIQVSKILAFSLFLWFLPSLTQAANPLDAVINEIAWMGTEVSYNDEWIELYNNTDSEINLDGWVLRAVDGSPEIELARSLLANGYYLLERTNDDSVPGIPANLIYTGALKNSGEDLKLYDSLGNIIDSVGGWLGGDNSTKQTMERINSLLTSDVNNWGMSQNPGGTPKAKNSIAATPPPTPEPEPEPQSEESEGLSEVAPPTATREATTTSAEVQPITYPSGVVINEILPSPIGPDSEEEWIEIYNKNNFEVSLSEWQIKDLVGKTNSYTFPEDTTISPQGFLVLFRPTTGITLNNSGDGLSLIQPDGEVVYTINYEKAPRGESFNRTKDEWVWSETPTPGSGNIIPVPEEKPQPRELKRTENGSLYAAAVGEQLPKSSNSRLAVLIALALAIFSGTIILLLKNKIKRGYN